MCVFLSLYGYSLFHCIFVAVVYNGDLYIFGGYNGKFDVHFGELYKFDVGKYSVQGRLKKPLHCNNSFGSPFSGIYL